MTRSKFSTKAVVLATGIGLSIAAFAGSQPAAAQSYSYTCPGGFVYDPTYGCTTAGADDLGYYDYPGGTVLYRRGSGANSQHEQTVVASLREIQARSTAFQTAGAARS
jgi:hypothetical protein